MRSERSWYLEIAEKLGPEDSIAAYLARKAGRDGLRELFMSLTDQQVATLVFDNDFWARRQQIPPETLWEVCLALAGRGFGKTWMGARWVNEKARTSRYIGALVGPTAADVRDTMVRGSSGIIALAPPWALPIYEPSKRKVTWPNGLYAICYSADKPDRMRGPNTNWCWGDEPVSWKNEMEAIDQIPLFNRIGTALAPPQLLLTGTPKPLKKLEALIKKQGTVVVTGSSLANRANLSPTTVRNMTAMRGTRWGRQEVLGELLMDVPGAIFGTANWKYVHADPHEYAKTLARRIVAVDPAPTSDDGSDESGIIVEGLRYENDLEHVAVLKDASLRGSPREWAAVAIHEYIAFDCDALVVEVNTGGEMVETIIKTVAAEMGVSVNVISVRAREAKSKRAEPVSAMAETGRIEFVGEPQTDDHGEPCGYFPKLEKQLAKFTGQAGRRDDRTDAMCWGIHDLAFREQFVAFVI